MFFCRFVSWSKHDELITISADLRTLLFLLKLTVFLFSKIFLIYSKTFLYLLIKLFYFTITFLVKIFISSVTLLFIISTKTFTVRFSQNSFLFYFTLSEDVNIHWSFNERIFKFFRWLVLIKFTFGQDCKILCLTPAPGW